jgi:hypothetical protein
VLISTGRGIFIGVQGGVIDLVKSVTRQVVARWPQGPASTDFWLQIPCYRLLKSVTIKLTRESLQSGAGRPGGLAGRPPPGPTGQQPLYTASSCHVESRGDNYFGRIPNFLIIFSNAPIWYLCYLNQINTKIVELG